MSKCVTIFAWGCARPDRLESKCKTSHILPGCLSPPHLHTTHWQEQKGCPRTWDCIRKFAVLWGYSTREPHWFPAGWWILQEVCGFPQDGGTAADTLGWSQPPPTPGPRLPRFPRFPVVPGLRPPALQRRARPGRARRGARGPRAGVGPPRRREGREREGGGGGRPCLQLRRLPNSWSHRGHLRGAVALAPRLPGPRPADFAEGARRRRRRVWAEPVFIARWQQRRQRRRRPVSPRFPARPPARGGLCSPGSPASQTPRARAAPAGEYAGPGAGRASPAARARRSGAPLARPPPQPPPASAAAASGPRLPSSPGAFPRLPGTARQEAGYSVKRGGRAGWGGRWGRRAVTNAPALLRKGSLDS